jgi:hypothetical protein
MIGKGEKDMSKGEVLNDLHKYLATMQKSNIMNRTKQQNNSKNNREWQKQNEQHIKKIISQ